MMSQIRAALVALAALTVVTGVAYPLLITGIAQAAFPSQANGSLIIPGGKAGPGPNRQTEPLGSRLIGQSFDDPKYFWGRLSATTDANGKALPYNGGSSVGSNLGPTNPALLDAVKARLDALKAADPDNPAPVPVDLVTASGSGLDPDISPAAAYYQVRRVAKARGVDEAHVRALVQAHTEDRQFWILGEPRVNVLELNLALDGV
jgi:K+-transporting ATPase ATPase C chain